MTKKITQIIAATMIGIVTMSGTANAKDWIESVSIGPNGIDVKAIDVVGNQNGHTKVKRSSHKFLLRMSAKAKSGKRIVAGKVGGYNGVRYFEGDGGFWNQRYHGRAVGNGKKRAVTLYDNPSVLLDKVKWYGPNPVGACKALINKKVSQGMKKWQVLGKTWTTSARVLFQFDAVAARKNKAKNGKWKLSNTTSERASYIYSVRVRCLPTTALHGG